MRKSDKKLDNQIIKALTEVCHHALEDIDGFQWLTHTVNFDNFPQSLKVVCVFDSNSSLTDYEKSETNHYLTTLIASKLTSIGLALNNINNQVELDSEENCRLYHAGNWHKRLS
ncbi:Fis family transcriptional regulator [Colwellia sp. M166]|uniref:Fis family transcriptional regulator n=1 Tax=Colwellia sp. M166 TaxID=2583805 RepID=UPI00211F3F11|nr:Fis family transcriptional regulator [Colwellia sp. M166]UUO25505.1 Fis family transcriptional regulator [Colwellia sp. M166]|tara:strand:- start:17616 stop:17957 length:342 start_codon:yes stop_codon:yes gene_type:complete